MTIEIDQSGKIEKTNKPTVVAFSNGKHRAIFISSTQKLILQKHFRNANKPRVFVYQLFAILIFLLVRNENINQITIDTEYPGQEPLIKSFLVILFRLESKEIGRKQITFRQIGKYSKAHHFAI